MKKQLFATFLTILFLVISGCSTEKSKVKSKEDMDKEISQLFDEYGWEDIPFKETEETLKEHDSSVIEFKSVEEARLFLEEVKETFGDPISKEEYDKMMQTEDLYPIKE